MRKRNRQTLKYFETICYKRYKMSRYMSMREQAELTELVRELRDNGELEVEE